MSFVFSSILRRNWLSAASHSKKGEREGRLLIEIYRNPAMEEKCAPMLSSVFDFFFFFFFIFEIPLPGATLPSRLLLSLFSFFLPALKHPPLLPHPTHTHRILN